MLNNSMTLYDLLEELTELRDTLIAEGKDDDILVVSSSNYGNHADTEQLVEIQSIEVVSPMKTAYSDSRWGYPDDEDLEPDTEKKVIVLRYQ